MYKHIFRRALLISPLFLFARAAFAAGDVVAPPVVDPVQSGGNTMTPGTNVSIPAGGLTIPGGMNMPTITAPGIETGVNGPQTMSGPQTQTGAQSASASGSRSASANSTTMSG